MYNFMRLRRKANHFKKKEFKDDRKEKSSLTDTLQKAVNAQL